MSWVQMTSRGTGRPRSQPSASVVGNCLYLSGNLADLIRPYGNRAELFVDGRKVAIVPGATGVCMLDRRCQVSLSAGMVIRELRLEPGDQLAYRGTDSVDGKPAFILEVPQ